jgi:transposase-like protein
MTKNDQREIQRKLLVIEHAIQTGQVAKTCRSFGIGRASFYRWKRADEGDGEAGLANARPIPKSSPTRHGQKSRRRFSA